MPLQLQNLQVVDEKERLFEGIATVEMSDNDGVIVPVDEAERYFKKHLERGGVLSLEHTNQYIGKVVKFWRDEIEVTPEMVEVAAAANPNRPGVKRLVERYVGKNLPCIRVQAKIYSDYPYEDEVWDRIKDQNRDDALRGLSFGGRSAAVEYDEEHQGIRHTLRAMWELAVTSAPRVALAVLSAVNTLAQSDAEVKEMCQACGHELKQEGMTTGTAGANNAVYGTKTFKAYSEDEEDMEKALEQGRKYIKDPSQAPKGANVQRGARGGYYYEESRSRNAPQKSNGNNPNAAGSKKPENAQNKNAQPASASQEVETGILKALQTSKNLSQDEIFEFGDQVEAMSEKLSGKKTEEIVEKIRDVIGENLNNKTLVELGKQAIGALKMGEWKKETNRLDLVRETFKDREVALGDLYYYVGTGDAEGANQVLDSLDSIQRDAFVSAYTKGFEDDKKVKELLAAFPEQADYVNKERAQKELNPVKVNEKPSKEETLNNADSQIQRMASTRNDHKAKELKQAEEMEAVPERTEEPLAAKLDALAAEIAELKSRLASVEERAAPAEDAEMADDEDKETIPAEGAADESPAEGEEKPVEEDTKQNDKKTVRVTPNARPDQEIKQAMSGGAAKFDAVAIASGAQTVSFSEIRGTFK